MYLFDEKMPGAFYCVEGWSSLKSGEGMDLGLQIQIEAIIPFTGNNLEWKKHSNGLFFCNLGGHKFLWKMGQIMITHISGGIFK
jgi:hypothetical protein